MKTFWFLLTIIAVVWYSTITVFVSYKGIADIRGMFKRLSDGADEDSGD